MGRMVVIIFKISIREENSQQGNQNMITQNNVMALHVQHDGLTSYNFISCASTRTKTTPFLLICIYDLYTDSQAYP